MAKRKNRANSVEPVSMERWEAEEDLRALARAKGVQSDPERMKKVKALAKEKIEESKRRKEEAQAVIDLGQELK